MIYTCSVNSTGECLPYKQDVNGSNPLPSIKFSLGGIMSSYDEGYKKGYNEGYEEGREKGHEEGFDEGYSEAYDELSEKYDIIP